MRIRRMISPTSTTTTTIMTTTTTSKRSWWSAAVAAAVAAVGARAKDGGGTSMEWQWSGLWTVGVVALIVLGTQIQMAMTNTAAAALLSSLQSSWLSWIGIGSSNSCWCFILWCWCVIEILFYGYFHAYMVPRANRRTLPTAQTYRDYKTVSSRHGLALRILRRMQTLCAFSAASDDSCLSTPTLQEYFTIFLQSWFRCNTTTTTTAAVVTAAIGAKITPPSLQQREEKEDETQIQKQHPPPLKHCSMSSTCSSSSNMSTESSESVTSRTSNSSSGSHEENSEEESDEVNGTTTIAGTASTTMTSPDYYYNRSSQFWTIPGMSLQAMQSSFAWAFFEKELADLTMEEEQELRRILNLLQTEVGGLTFLDENEKQNTNADHVSPAAAVTTTSVQYQAHRLSLEDVQACHRPLLVYLFVQVLQWIGAAVLLLAGFERTSCNGLTGWIRLATNTRSTSHHEHGTSEGKDPLPLVFFHGIAPAGLVLYIPLIFLGLGREHNDTKASPWRWWRSSRERTIVLFDNPSISCSLWNGFSVLSEAETCQSVKTVLDRFLPPSTEICVAGHSFGSVPITWLLHCPEMACRIRRAILLDPITLLLSDPDVLMNFVYHSRISVVTRAIARTELFTQFYLRRHFPWYNAELWLEDLTSLISASSSPQDGQSTSTTHAGAAKKTPKLQLLVALSGRDEIVNASKVRRYVEWFQQEHAKGNAGSAVSVHLLYWPTAVHAACASSPDLWRQLQQAVQQLPVDSEDGH